MKLPITYLFVPGNRPERFDKAFATAAGAIILDLEDAVIPVEKAGARDAIAHWVEGHADAAERIVVRVNDTQSQWFADDLAMIRDTGIHLFNSERVAVEEYWFDVDNSNFPSLMRPSS